MGEFYQNPNIDEVSTCDFFAGGGGFTFGASQVPGIKVKWMLNHDAKALKTNQFHNPDTKCLTVDIYHQDEHELDPVDFAHGSVECTQHTPALGKNERKLGSYMMGWEMLRYFSFLKPILIGIENVKEFKKWGPVDENNKPIKSRQGEEFEKWKKAIMDLGYEYKESIRNAADDGLPTRRVRYFGFFHRPGLEISFPESTHSQYGLNGLPLWLPCRPHINTEDEGMSIFGREFNMDLPKHLRNPICDNSLKRLAGGIKKFVPEFRQFVNNFYGTMQFQSLQSPLNTIRTGDCHQLVSVSDQVTMEKIKFIMDHCHSDNYNLLDEPLNPILCRQTKQQGTVQWLSHMNNSNGNPGANVQSLEDPIWAATCEQKIQFITNYFNAGGKPGSQNSSLDSSLNAILCNPNKQALVTILDGFDIKTRFLNREELSAVSTFPRDYFSKQPGLMLSNKDACRMIGNAIPPEWVKKIIEHNMPAILDYKKSLVNKLEFADA